MPDTTDNPSPARSSTPTPVRSTPDPAASETSMKSKAADEARGIRDEALDKAGGVKDRAVEEVGQVAGDARDEARTLVTEVRGELAGQANDATSRVVSAIADAADELRAMAEHSDRPDGAMTALVREAADRGSDLARGLETRGYQGVADDLARFGRNHAGMFLLAAGAAGVIVGRLLRNIDAGAVVDAAKDELSSGNGQTGTGADAPTTRSADPVLATAGSRPGSVP
jgi:hypothetical protein